jgi:Chlorophyll A-B binding protein
LLIFFGVALPLFVALCALTRCVSIVTFFTGWDKQTDAWKTKKRATELNQGRAAQMGILALMVHDQLGNVDTILPFAN